MIKLNESRRRCITAPSIKIVIDAVPPAIPAFLITAMRVRTEQHTTRLQTCMQFQQHTRQLLARYMKQRGIGEYAVKMIIRQVEF